MENFGIKSTSYDVLIAVYHAETLKSTPKLKIVRILSYKFFKKKILFGLFW